jgi:hypothetical protein
MSKRLQQLQQYWQRLRVLAVPGRTCSNRQLCQLTHGWLHLLAFAHSANLAPLMLLLLVLLQCYKLIYGYMGFAMLNIFFFFTGALVLQLLRLIGLHMDLFSLAFLLFNFSVRNSTG